MRRMRTPSIRMSPAAVRLTSPLRRRVRLSRRGSLPHGPLGPGRELPGFPGGPTVGRWMAFGPVPTPRQSTRTVDERGLRAATFWTSLPLLGNVSEGWPTEEVWRAQAKVREAGQRKVPPKWLRYLERTTHWVDTAPLPSPVGDARMPGWARGVLLAKVSRAPRGLPREGPAPEGIRGPADTCGRDGSISVKRKRGSETPMGRLPELPA